MSCTQTLLDYGLRSIGIGERLLPKKDISLCEQVVLIGSGMLWNVYFALLAVVLGFFLATALAVARNSNSFLVRKPADWFVFLFRGSPLFIQFFFAYELFSVFPRNGIDLNLAITTITIETSWLTKAWLGALIVLFLNTSAYSAEIFYGALRAVPRGDIEAADAFGFSGLAKFRKIIWPSLGFPTWRQKGDALYYASYFAEKTYNPFIPYPIAAVYFILFTLLIILFFNRVNNRLNRHLPSNEKSRVRYRPNLMR